MPAAASQVNIKQIKILVGKSSYERTILAFHLYHFAVKNNKYWKRVLMASKFS